MQSTDKKPSLWLMFALIPVSIAFSGYVLMCLWSWFVVPIFNLPNLDMIQSAGVLTVSMFLRSTVKQQLDTSDIIVSVFAKPLMFLGIGFVISLFM